MATTETLNIVITTKAQGDGAKKAESGLKSLANAAQAFAGAMAVKQIAQYTAELAQLGATSQRQAAALDNLADAAGTSGDAITDAIREASDYTIDRMGAMEAANRAMVMDVAKSPQEFERLTKVAVALGRAMGQDATKSIDDFVTASARQSQMIADNLGLTVTVGQATERYAAQLGIAADELTDAQKKQAFLNMMLEEGEKKMAELGDATLDNAGKIEQASATWETFRSVVGEGVASALLGTQGDLGKINQALDEHGSKISWVIEQGLGWAAQNTLFGQALSMFTNSVKDTSEETDSATRSYMAMARAMEGSTQAGEEQTRVVEEQKTAVVGIGLAVRREAAMSQEELERTVRGANTALEEQVDAMDNAGAAADRLSQASLGTAAQYASAQESAAESAQRFADKREELERKHQEKLAKLAEQGQARAVRIDEDAENEKLDALRRRLEIAIQQQAEFTGKTKESTRMRKEDQITSLQEQIGTQEKLLSDYHAGRLTTAGKNVDDLIAEENRQYEAALTGLEASQAKQEEAQRQSLGRMVLQHFNAWVEMNVAADGFTEEEAEAVARMREDINREYGLITDAAIEEMNKQESGWRTTMGQMMGDANVFFGEFERRFNALPKERVIRIREELASTPEDIPENALGTGFATGGVTLVGERGPELVQMPRGARVFSAGPTRQMMRGAGGAVNIGPVYITGESPEAIWRKLERYARLKGKSGWQQLGR